MLFVAKLRLCADVHRCGPSNAIGVLEMAVFLKQTPYILSSTRRRPPFLPSSCGPRPTCSRCDAQHAHASAHRNTPEHPNC